MVDTNSVLVSFPLIHVLGNSKGVQRQPIPRIFDTSSPNLSSNVGYLAPCVRSLYIGPPADDFGALGYAAVTKEQCAQ
jgi:hypothetical protein